MEKEEDEGTELNWMLVYQNKVEGLISLLNLRSQETQHFYFYFISFMYEKDYKALDHWWPIVDVRIQGNCRTTLNCNIYIYIYTHTYIHIKLQK